MIATHTFDIRVTRRFDASAERVFDAWLDPDMARRFLFATPAGEMVRVEIDARVGGRFLIIERRDGEDAEHVGEYVEIDRPHRLVFSFWSGGSEPSSVTIEIASDATGCELTLTHEIDAQYADYEERTRGGWSGILEGLAAAVDRGS